MRVSIIAVGKLKSGPERELIARYRTRFAAIGKGLGLSGPDVVELNESRGRSGEERKQDEAKRALRAVPDHAFVIALDEHGKNTASKAFAQKVQVLLNEGQRDLVLMIGGADGHGTSVLQRADLLLSFGQLTWPHQLVRLMLMEQLFRVTTILAGHPYHRT